MEGGERRGGGSKRGGLRRFWRELAWLDVSIPRSMIVREDETESLSFMKESVRMRARTELRMKTMDLQRKTVEERRERNKVNFNITMYRTEIDAVLGRHCLV